MFVKLFWMFSLEIGRRVWEGGWSALTGMEKQFDWILINNPAIEVNSNDFWIQRQLRLVSKLVTNKIKHKKPDFSIHKLIKLEQRFFISCFLFPPTAGDVLRYLINRMTELSRRTHMWSAKSNLMPTLSGATRRRRRRIFSSPFHSDWFMLSLIMLKSFSVFCSPTTDTKIEQKAF